MMGKMLKNTNTFNLVAGIILAAVPLLSARPAYAASATLSLSPASSSVTNGSTFTVNVRVNSDEPVNAAEVHLSYPANLLQYVRINSSSAWSFEFASSGGNGAVRIDRGANPAAKGDSLIASVQFKALSSSGSAAVNVDSGSQVLSESSGNNILTGRNGANYSLKAPTPAAQAAQDKIAPTISKPPAVSGITRNSVVISWSTSEPSTSEVSYGLNTGYGLSAVDPKLVTEHSLTISSPVIEAGTTYHYMVKSVDAAGNAVSSNDGTFSTRGYDLDVKVINQRKSAVSGAKVTIDGKSGVTNRSGQATIKDLPLGRLAGTVEHKGKKTTVDVTVEAPKAEGKNQTATFQIKTAKNIWLTSAAVLAALALAAALGWKYLKQRRGGRGGGAANRPSPNSNTNLSSSPPSTIITPTSGK